MVVRLKAITPKHIFKVAPPRMVTKLRIAQQLYLNRVKTLLQVYPPPGNRYVRTFELRRDWHVSVNSDGSVGELTNDTEYAVYVQGPRGGGRGPGERQTSRNRKKGWLSVSDVARATKKDFVTVVNRSLNPEAD